MKQNTNKLLSFLLTLAMILTMVPAFTVTAFAEGYTIKFAMPKEYLSDNPIVRFYNPNADNMTKTEEDITIDGVEYGIYKITTDTKPTRDSYFYVYLDVPTSKTGKSIVASTAASKWYSSDALKNMIAFTASSKWYSIDVLKNLVADACRTKWYSDGDWQYGENIIAVPIDYTKTKKGNGYVKFYDTRKTMPSASDFTFTTPSALTYDGQFKEAFVTTKSGITGMGAVTVFYSTDGEEWTDTPVKNANTYLVAIDVAEGSSYASATKLQDPSWTFTIAKADMTLTAPAKTVWTYDGEEHEGEVTCNVTGAAITYYVKSGAEYELTQTASVKESGKKEFKAVATCENYNDATLEYTLEVQALPNYTHSIKVSEAENGKVTMTPETAKAGKTVTLTVTPDKGYTLETITVLNAAGKEIELTAVKEGETFTFKMPSGNVTVKATFMEDNTMLNYFVDVTADDYFYDAVLWAAENGITAGVDNLRFGPDETVTRAQMVTFLWNAAGQPVVNYAMSFTDVSEDAWYAEAVRWAVSEGITSGTSATTFSPNAIVNRAQAVTFLWNAAKAPKFANMTAEGPAPSPFEDVATDTYYYNAVLWAKAEGITSGTSDTTFSPADECIRGQIVTFLYKNSVK